MPSPLFALFVLLVVVVVPTTSEVLYGIEPSTNHAQVLFFFHSCLLLVFFFANITENKKSRLFSIDSLAGTKVCVLVVGFINFFQEYIGDWLDINTYPMCSTEIDSNSKIYCIYFISESKIL